MRADALLLLGRVPTIRLSRPAEAVCKIWGRFKVFTYRGVTKFSAWAFYVRPRGLVGPVLRRRREAKQSDLWGTP
jgi:hypothetical protein